MAFEVKETRTYPAAAAAVFQAAQGAVANLKGQVLTADAAKGRLEARFDKKLQGKVLGDRTQIEVQVRAQEPDRSAVAVLIYPLDALNRKLQFGARKGVPETVMAWFFESLEHQLGAYQAA